MAATVQVEIERKYEVQEGSEVPPLDGVLDGVVETRHPAARLTAVYYDTDDGRLGRHLIVLRRREGGYDEGWHTKSSEAGHRLETHWPLTAADAGIPEEVLDTVRVHVRDRELSPLARIETERTVIRLAVDGVDVAEIADDLVTATDVRAGIVRSWREWEAELVTATHPDDDDPQLDGRVLLDAIEKRLRSAGATPSPSPAKLARALGLGSLDASSSAGSESAVMGSSHGSHGGHGSHGSHGGHGSHGTSHGTRGRADVQLPPELAPGSAGAAIMTAFSGLVDALVAADPAARRDDEDAVHAMRTVVRRLRSLLASYRKLFDDDTVIELRHRLRVLGATLGDVRDLEVRADRARTIIGAAPGELVDDPAQHRVVAGDAHDAAHERLRGALSADYYFRLLDALDAVVAAPPLSRRARRPVTGEFRRDIHRSARRVERRIQALSSPLTIAAFEAADPATLHELRKSARRLRYAIEVALDVAPDHFGKKYRRTADAAEAVQDALGGHRDDTLLAESVLIEARRSEAASEPAFAYGLLYAAATASAAESLGEARGAVRELAKLLDS
ncbi:CYTH and CHAD domain-containing protein [Compostimonas suwonensis]|uniref:CHAD domain-containing protein n=1 Tax=Compostimonas suwonensis TaxID=1048394 RepID=A0A2M9BVZ4_9MICO|nr:CYTH and CHAD domain-containing protein [Compostimonas suwonensis]PJJ62111.1 CHAD domain-containing protein [Compostimonas suwonensis]